MLDQPGVSSDIIHSKRKWVAHIEQACRDEHVRMMINKGKETYHLRPLHIKSMKGIDRKLMAIQDWQTLNFVLHLRAQSIGSTADINRRPGSRWCNCVKAVPGLYHYAFECKRYEAAREALDVEIEKALEPAEWEALQSQMPRQRLEIVAGLAEMRVGRSRAEDA